MLTKLNQEVVQIAVFGLVGRGKSSLLNALLGERVFVTGATHGVTQQVEMCPWRLSETSLAEARLAEVGSPGTSLAEAHPAQGVPGPNLQTLSLPSLGQSRIELVDTPGLDEIDGESREKLARRVAKRVDLILFVVSGDITQVEYDALLTLRQA
ncbi:MAG: dynamin family protein, partial [Prochlorothrix sp.]